MCDLERHVLRIVGLGLALPITEVAEGAEMFGVEPQPILTPQMEAQEKTMAAVVAAHFERMQSELEHAALTVRNRITKLAAAHPVLEEPYEESGNGTFPSEVDQWDLLRRFGETISLDPEFIDLLDKLQTAKKFFGMAKRVLGK